jgi:hypothetical protein
MNDRALHCAPTPQAVTEWEAARFEQLPQGAPAADTTPRTTAAHRAMPLEKVPSAGLAEPSEQVPSAAAPEVPRTYFPFPISMTEIEAFFSRFSAPVSTTGSGNAPSPE